jgi:hypothetical protein
MSLVPHTHQGAREGVVHGNMYDARYLGMCGTGLPGVLYDPGEHGVPLQFEAPAKWDQ